MNLFKINTRLKPYKKLPPNVFQTAKNVYLSIDDDQMRKGAIKPKGKKEGILWDVGPQPTMVKTSTSSSLAIREINSVPQSANYSSEDLA